MDAARELSELRSTECNVVYVGLPYAARLAR